MNVIKFAITTNCITTRLAFHTNQFHMTYNINNISVILNKVIVLVSLKLLTKRLAML